MIVYYLQEYIVNFFCFKEFGLKFLIGRIYQIRGLSHEYYADLQYPRGVRKIIYILLLLHYFHHCKALTSLDL